MPRRYSRSRVPHTVGSGLIESSANLFPTLIQECFANLSATLDHPHNSIPLSPQFAVDRPPRDSYTLYNINRVQQLETWNLYSQALTFGGSRAIPSPPRRFLRVSYRWESLVEINLFWGEHNLHESVRHYSCLCDLREIRQHGSNTGTRLNRLFFLWVSVWLS